MPEMSQGAPTRGGPTAVGLTRLSTRLSFPPGAEAMYRSLLRQVGLTGASEFLVAPCGRGGSPLFVARSTGAGGAGADPDPGMVSAASQRARSAGWAGRLHFEQAPPGDLPYQSAVFDLTVGELALGEEPDPATVVRELTRVTKPDGTVVRVQLVWTRPVRADARAALVGRLGVRPRMPMEWKGMLQDAGVHDLCVEDWSDAEAGGDRPPVLGGLMGLFTLRGRLIVLPRAWKRWGWRGVRAAVARERELRHSLESERVLGVALIRGTRPDGIATGGIE